jgi:hypothetical protein
MEDVHNHICSAIYQNNVPPNQHMRAIRRRWRQPPLEIFGARLESFLKPWRERAAPYQLFFQSGGQPVSLSKPRRKVTLVVVIPSAHNLTVMILIELFVAVVIIPMLAVSLSVPVSVTLG